MKSFPTVIECPALTDVTNGAIVYVSDMTAPYDIGTTATHSCNSGYSLVGDEIRICGTNGEWDLSEPSCERKLYFKASANLQSNYVIVDL